MDRKKKILFGVSLGFNILFVLVITWGFFKINYVTERTLFNEVEIKLLKLEDSISHQRENNWSQPYIVTERLGEVMNGIDSSMNIGAASRTLSKREIELLSDLNSNLREYQKHLVDTLDDLIEISDEDKKRYEKLGDHLLKIGFRKRMEESLSSSTTMSTSKHIDSILNQVAELTKVISETN